MRCAMTKEEVKYFEQLLEKVNKKAKDMGIEFTGYARDDRGYRKFDKEFLASVRDNGGLFIKDPQPPVKHIVVMPDNKGGLLFRQPQRG